MKDADTEKINWKNNIAPTLKGIGGAVMGADIPLECMFHVFCDFTLYQGSFREDCTSR